MMNKYAEYKAQYKELVKKAFLDYDSLKEDQLLSPTQAGALAGVVGGAGTGLSNPLGRGNVA